MIQDMIYILIDESKFQAVIHSCYQKYNKTTTILFKKPCGMLNVFFFFPLLQDRKCLQSSLILQNTSTCNLLKSDSLISYPKWYLQGSLFLHRRIYFLGLIIISKEVMLFYCGNMNKIQVRFLNNHFSSNQILGAYQTHGKLS